MPLTCLARALPDELGAREAAQQPGPCGGFQVASALQGGATNEPVTTPLWKRISNLPTTPCASTWVMAGIAFSADA